MSAQVFRLPTGYEPVQSPMEKPVSRKRIAELFGVSTRTVDRWVERGMPRVDPNDRFSRGCWVQSGYQRRFYPSRVEEWLER